MPCEDEEPREYLAVAALTGFSVRFWCHDKIMEVTQEPEAAKFVLCCDLCGKKIRGEIGGDE
jgi:hypothetical protein